MTQDVINLLFAGDSHDLLPRYGDGIRRFRDSGGVGPEQLVVAHSDQGLHVTLVWGEGVDHELLGHFLLGRLTELGLPRPTVNHGTLATTSWNTLSAVTSG